MNMLLLFGIILTAFIAYSIASAVGKSKHPVKKTAMGMFTGIIALVAVNLLSPLTSVAVPISALSVLVSVIGGVPGVTLILSLNAFF